MNRVLLLNGQEYSNVVKVDIKGEHAFITYFLSRKGFLANNLDELKVKGVEIKEIKRIY